MNSDASEVDTWKKEINLFLSVKRAQKELDLLNKKHNKKPPSDKRQATLVQLLHFLEANEGTADEAVEIKNRKNTGASKVEPLLFQQKKYNELIALGENKREVLEIKENHESKLQDINTYYEPMNWINREAENAQFIMFATNVGKLTHPSARASSFFVPASAETHRYLETSSISAPVLDCAVDNAKYLPVSSFLQIQVKSHSLADCILASDSEPFRWVTDDDELIKAWVSKFEEAFITRSPKAHKLSKQVYFPAPSRYTITDAPSYHLLCNVNSSSLVHELFNRLNIPSMDLGGKYRNGFVSSFPGKAKIAVTASRDAHKNVSPLNVQRDGKTSLLPCCPPHWQSQLKPPLNKESFFYARAIYQNSKETIAHLRDFLLWNQQANLSVKKPDKKKWIAGWVNQIIDEVFTYVFTIQNISAGWSGTEKIKLKAAHRYLLDPYRTDEQFRQGWQTEDWQTVICVDFAKWLNGRLVGKDKKFTPQSDHNRMWQDLMAEELREHCQTLEFAIKQQREEMT